VRGGDRGEAHPVSPLEPHRADLPAQHRVLVPEREQLGIVRPVTAERQDGRLRQTAQVTSFPAAQ
jgi:hypothetical protein